MPSGEPPFPPVWRDGEGIGSTKAGRRIDEPATFSGTIAQAEADSPSMIWAVSSIVFIAAAASL
jgi:hypothetical protein